MKYCSKCKKVYPDDVTCECLKDNYSDSYLSEYNAEMKDVDCELVCKTCDSKENLSTYHEPWKWLSRDHTEPSYCTCHKCDEKVRIERERQKSMKYYVIDSNQGENKLCDDTNELEEFLEYYTEDSEYESGSIDGVLILKLEPLTDVLKESDFKPQRLYKDGEFTNQQEPNTHIVIIDDEIFRVEDVSVSEIEYNGGRSISW
jgi:hypothetical protein